MAYTLKVSSAGLCRSSSNVHRRLHLAPFRAEPVVDCMFADGSQPSLEAAKVLIFADLLQYALHALLSHIFGVIQVKPSRLGVADQQKQVELVKRLLRRLVGRVFQPQKQGGTRVFYKRILAGWCKIFAPRPSIL